MTRINVAIKPEELHDKHLLAEHREIKRIPNAIHAGRYNMSGIPEQFTLGTGHVKFFYNKLKYLWDRYRRIHNECLKRGFKVHEFNESFMHLPKELWNDYEPTVRDREILKERLMEKDYSYYKDL